MLSAVNIKQFGAKGDGIADDTASIQAALNSGASEVFGANGSFKCSSYLLVPAGVAFKAGGWKFNLVATGNIPQYVPWGANHQLQMVILLGDDSSAEGLCINGANFNAGGVAAYNQNNNNIKKNRIMNTGTSQAILTTASKDIEIVGNRTKYTSTGIQLWQTDGAIVAHNIIRVSAGGGIFTADAENLTCSANFISDCTDVGLDFEGGINCEAIGNVVNSCNNGELAVFTNGTGSGRTPFNLKFIGNTVTRTSTYKAGVAETPTATAVAAGGIQLSSAFNGQRQIIFENNTVYSNGRIPLYSNDLGANYCGIILKGNTFASNGQIFNLNRAVGIDVRENTFKGLTGSESVQNFFKDCMNGFFCDNIFEYENTKTTNEALIYLTSVFSNGVSPGPVISGNKFYNCGAWAFKHDPFDSGVQALLSGNLFTLGRGDTIGYEANGGVNNTIAGYPLMRGQKLFLEAAPALNLATVTALTPGGFYRGKLICEDGNTMGSAYEFVYSTLGPTLTSRDGSGVSSGIGASATRYATFAGTTITITGPLTPHGKMEVDCTTWL